MIVLVTSKFTESSTKLKKSSNWQYFCAGFAKWDFLSEPKFLWSVIHFGN